MNEIQVYKPNQLSLSSKIKLAECLSLSTESAIFSGLDPISWQGTDWLKSLVDVGHSCLIKGDPGSGKSSAVEAITPCEPNIVEDGVVIDAGDPGYDQILTLAFDQESGVFRHLWDLIGRPVPRLVDRLEDVVGGKSIEEWCKTDMHGNRFCTVCIACPRRCVIDWLPKGYASYAPPLRDDLRDGLAKLEWACPVIINFVKRALTDPSFSKSYPDLSKYSKIVIRLPNDASSDLFDILETLLAGSRILVVLGTPEQVEQLKKRPVFNNLPEYSFPKPDFTIFTAVLRQRGLVVPDGVARLAALVCGVNFTKFLNLLRTAIVEATGEITPDQLLALVGEVSIDAMIAVALASFRPLSHVSTLEVQQEVFNLFGKQLTSKMVGLVLAKNLKRSRRSTGVRYFLPKKLPMELLGKNSSP